MQFRDVFPKPFDRRESSAPVTSATRTAVREFFPIFLILIAVDLSTDGILLGRFEIIPTLTYSVPAHIYLFAFLGAGAYAVTSLAFNPKQSIIETYRLTYRLIGALPLGAGVYLLSDVLVDASTVPVPVAGLAFLSGLYIRLTLRRLGDLAERLYGGESTATAEMDRHRTATNEHLRHGWRLLTTSPPPDGPRREVREQLERAEAILDDSDATRQELHRARSLSEQALSALREGTPGASGTAPADAPGADHDTDPPTTVSGEKG